MILKDAPIRRKLMTVNLMTSGAVLVLTCSAFFAYEFLTFRQTTVRQLSILGEITATTSTAALAFDDREDAIEILSALTAEKHIVAAALYDSRGNLFATYPAGVPAGEFPETPGEPGYQFGESALAGFQPVLQGERKLGTLFLKSDMGAIYERFQLYGLIALLVIVISFLIAYLISNILQKRISGPIMSLADTANAISGRHNYSVRAVKTENDELGSLTDAFNQMLEEIERQTHEIKQFSQNLEQKVIERTSEMEIANKELEAFSYSVSHDLRAPLRSIHGYMNIFSEEYMEKLDDEGKKLVGIVLKNSHRMGQLIDDLLAFSKMGRKEMARSRTDMDALVQDVLREVTPQENGHLNIKVGNLKPALADNSMFRQVWTNLISNAIKYSRKKESSEIEIGCYDKDDRTFYYVKDNGAGFDMEYVDKLFGVFQRLHKANEFEGTGVGLALVKRIIQRHGGEIWAEGKINEGAKFSFTIGDSNKK